MAVGDDNDHDDGGRATGRAWISYFFGPDRASHWTVVAGVMAVVVPLVSLVVWLVGKVTSSPPAPPPAPSAVRGAPPPPEEHVAACRRGHFAPVKRTPEAPAEEKVYGDCSWPPVAGARPDGYYEIRLREYPIPGASGADRFTSAQVFTTSCAAVKLQYKFENQGSSVQEDAVTYINDQITSIYDGAVVQIPGSLEPTLGFTSNGRLIILSHFRYALNSAVCVDPP